VAGDRVEMKLPPMSFTMVRVDWRV